MRSRLIALCLGLAVTLGLALPAQAQQDVTVLQDAGGQGYSQPNAINASGQSVGYSYRSCDGQACGFDAVLWSPSGKATVLQDTGGEGASAALAINDAGQSVGYSHTFSGQDAALWSPSGNAIVIQRVGGPDYSNTFAINGAA